MRSIKSLGKSDPEPRRESKGIFLRDQSSRTCTLKRSLTRSMRRT
jgi:hypothetical protein